MTVKGCCLEWEQEMTLYLDREMPENSRRRVERHLKKCDMCSRYYRELERDEQLLAGELRSRMDDLFFAPEFAASVMEALPAYQPNPLVQQTQLLWQRVHELFFSQGHRHWALAGSMVVCVVAILLSFKMGNVEEQPSLNLKRNGSFTRIGLPDLFFISRLEGEFFEFPDTSLVYAPEGSLFTVDAYQQSNEATTLGTERRISLKMGEIFVDVHPAKEGFSVVCSNAKATVFGTQFYVAISPGPEKRTVIGVREGNVMVEKLGRGQMGSTMVPAGQMTSVVTQNGKVILHAPEAISTELRAKLDHFNEIRSNRSAQRSPLKRNPFESGDLMELNPFPPVLETAQ